MIEGKRITPIRPMTKAELDGLGWDTYSTGDVPVIEIEGGVRIFPSCDPEGNGPGSLFGVDPDGEFRLQVKG